VDPRKKEADMSDDLSRVMQTATADLHPNVGKLTAGGIERGVRKRRVRRFSQIAGGAASVTAVFAVVATVGAPGHGSGSNVSAASGTATTPTAAATSSSAAVAPSTSSPAAKPAAAPPVSGEDMVKWLKQELAPYGLTDQSVLFKNGSENGAAFATLKVGYSGGVGSLALTVSRANWADQHLGSTLPPYITVSNLPDGSHLMVFDGPEYPQGNGDPKEKRLDVAWYRTDGTEVDVMVLNQAMEKAGATATGLALTQDQATKLVQSPVWDQAIASVLSEPAPGKTPPSNAPGLYVGSGKGAATSPTSSPTH
jgi:hypothetical protein